MNPQIMHEVFLYDIFIISESGLHSMLLKSWTILFVSISIYLTYLSLGSFCLYARWVPHATRTNLINIQH